MSVSVGSYQSSHSISFDTNNNNSNRYAFASAYKPLGLRTAYHDSDSCRLSAYNSSKRNGRISKEEEWYLVKIHELTGTLLAYFEEELAGSPGSEYL